jgi:chromatin modification-related protein EAF6
MRVTGEQQPLRPQLEPPADVSQRNTKISSVEAQIDSALEAEPSRTKKKRARSSLSKPAALKEGTGPLSEIRALERGKRELEEKLARIERQIYDMETSYLEDTWSQGNVSRGWDNILRKGSRQQDGNITGGRGSSAHSARLRKMQDSDRIFSRSSVTSPVKASSVARSTAAAESAYKTGSQRRSASMSQRQKRRRSGTEGLKSVLIPADIAEASLSPP